MRIKTNQRSVSHYSWVKGLRKHCWFEETSLALEAKWWRLVEEKMGRGGWGTVLTLYQRFSDGLKSHPSVPQPITSPGRSAGVGGECTGQKQSLLPPRHSLTTLPKLDLSGPELQLDYAGMQSYSTLICASSYHPAFFDLETSLMFLAQSGGWRGLYGILSCKLQGSLILVRMTYSALSYISGKQWQETSYCDIEQWKWWIFLRALISVACSNASQVTWNGSDIKEPSFSSLVTRNRQCGEDMFSVRGIWEGALPGNLSPDSLC